MKIIDLLNKIAKGEEVPKEINVDGIFYEYNRWGNDYSEKDKTTNYWLFGDYTFGSNGNRLNSEVEIIEEEKEIEKLIINSQGNIEKKLIDGSTIVLPTKGDEILHIAYKINELIDEINELKSGKDD